MTIILLRLFERAIKLRALLLLSVASCMLVTILFATGQTQNTRESEAVSLEHRLTTVEVEIRSLREDLNSMKIYHWLQILGLSGLLGETGIRLLGRR